MKTSTTVLLLVIISFIGFAQKNTNPRAQWFTDARFGMFIHWGVYSGAEGYWKGEKLRNDNDYAEWIMYRNRISKGEYTGLLDRFVWDEINPEEWVLLAKESGMKYVTITAKHHDGFALWNSQIGDFHLGHYTSPKRDIIKELAVACKKNGLKLGIYYSHWVDWEHKYGWDHSREIYGISSENYDEYWQQKVLPQVRELLSNYGDIAMMWFDMWIHHSNTIVTKEQLLQLKSLIRELQPNCLVNSRLGLSIEEDPDIDFKTLGDNQLGNQKEDFPWQSPATVAHSWGFHATDNQWKSTTFLLKALIGNVSLNGNFMLNIGPRANGKVPFEISHRMQEMGKWLEANGDAIYGAEAFNLNNDLHDWGKITCKTNSDKFYLYLHVYNWPLNKKLGLSGILSTPEKVYILADKQKSQLAYSHTGAFTEIHLPNNQPNNYISVLALEYAIKPQCKNGLVAKTSDGGYTFLPQNQQTKNKGLTSIPSERGGTVPKHVLITNTQTMTWEIYIDEPGEKNLDISYSYQGEESNSKITLICKRQEHALKVKPTGQTVGEPNRNWHIDNFKSHKIATINFPEQGYYKITAKFEVTNNEKLQFQWLWLK